MDICFTQIEEKVAAPSGDLLFTRVLSYAPSVAKADCVQGGAARKCIREEINGFCGYTNGPFRLIE